MKGGSIVEDVNLEKDCDMADDWILVEDYVAVRNCAEDMNDKVLEAAAAFVTVVSIGWLYWIISLIQLLAKGGFLNILTIILLLIN